MCDKIQLRTSFYDVEQKKTGVLEDKGTVLLFCDFQSPIEALIGECANAIAKKSLLYYTIGAGDCKVTITRLYESVHMLKYIKEFYFDMNGESAEKNYEKVRNRF